MGRAARGSEFREENPADMFVETAQGLKALCGKLSSKILIGFDTEFVSEDSYRPELCLVQVAAEGIAAVIDPLSCGPLDAFWEVLLDPSKTVVVHSGREEILFCIRATGRIFPKLFDIQIAAALLGSEFPASFANLVQKFTGKVLDKEETRSDWRQRPLTQRQLQYALQDVVDLPVIYAKLQRELEDKGRLTWLAEEVDRKQKDLLDAEGREQWHRVGGVTALSGRSQAVARRLWLWRESEAKRRSVPPRRVLRDDLLLELARRASSDIRRMATLRGMNHRHVRDLLPQIAVCIEQGLKDDAPAQPMSIKQSKTPLSGTLVQFLMAGLAVLCRERRVAPSIVATTEDLRELVAYRLGHAAKGRMPKLLQGWRGQVVGDQLDGLMTGKQCLLVNQTESDRPLEIRPYHPVENDDATK